MKKPLVTIITITLNRPSLKEACKSVDNQTYKNYYHIVLGDGVLPTDYSTDKRMCLGFSKVMGITEPGANMPNGSPNPMQRWALKNLDLGDYVCFLDDDNTYEKDYLEKMVQALNKSGKGVALCGAKDFRYGQNIDGYPEDYRCDNSAFMARRDVVKDIEFPKASIYKNVVQDCEYIKLCCEKYGFVNVPFKLLNFGTSDNIPPDRGRIFFLESWKQPQEAYELALKMEYVPAIKILKKAINQNANDAWSIFKLIEIYLVLNDNISAKKYINQYLTLINKTDQSHSYLSYTKAFCYKILYKDYIVFINQAIKEINKQVKGDKSNLFFLSAYYLFSGEVSKAKKNYVYAKTIFPNDDFWANKEFEWMLRGYEHIEGISDNVKQFREELK